ncbi:AAA family ATPase [Balneolaceae bacterium YR4-1]|uniref:AAA family ATPase n=1 Tax=Halalkalibaculum roseum TaxID=2709311 RepID=A0A6M1T3X1_9BACT|nr:AAA domain-containing protein [Halalkalibaculum roseum]NGP77437.1 AAA family ATPase [Halalkalibaculum roseum]
MTDKKIKKLIKKAIEAVEDEIDTVREKPAHDVLFQGKRKEKHPPGVFYYEFESQNTSLRFAEVIRGEMEDYEKELELYPVEVGEKKVVLHFPHNFGNELTKVSLEWENDFVLRRLHRELDKLLDSEEEEARERIGRLFDPDPKRDHSDEETRVLDDSRRNEAQHEALIKALQNRVLYVWGPPGTGKTSTLGFMMANYLVKSKRVLFASNTNRAVDVGLLSALEALTAVEKEHLEKKVTRFGEIALDSERLEEVLFEKQIKEREEKQKIKASKLSNVLNKYQKLQKEIDNLMEHGEDVPKVLDEEINNLGEQLDEHGGEAAVEEKIERMLTVNERFELEKRELVATTLAKVCTSELFDGQEFDAVVIDEASMANLPYLMVLAAKAKDHIVVVGDPMQLPPIALTGDAVSRDFLEKDIFTFASKSESTEDLFNWHDFNRPVTTFFDVQYRLNKDLADVLSSVFYEDRLNTVDLEKEGTSLNYPEGNKPDPTVNVIDTRRYGPVLTQKDEGRGFSPVNEVHLFLLVKIVKKLVMKNHVPVDEIGIIVPFRSTVYDIRQELYREGFEQVEVGTIHTFQGREKQVIIFDTVMSGEMQYGSKRHYSVRPFDEDKNGLAVPRLLNVALSRSKERLVILADMDHVNKIYPDKYLGQLLRRFQDDSEQ